MPQINVKLNWHTYLKTNIFFEQTDKRTDGQSDFIMPQILFGGHKNILFQTDGQTDERTNRRSDFIMAQILFGGIKTSSLFSTTNSTQKSITTFPIHL